MKELENKKYKSVSRIILIGKLPEIILLIFITFFLPLMDIVLDYFRIAKPNLVIAIIIYASSIYFMGSFLYTKWHLWAFKNTKKEDWIELEQRAFEREIITKKNYWFRTKHQIKLIKEFSNEIEKLRVENNQPYLESKQKSSYNIYGVLFLFCNYSG